MVLWVRRHVTVACAGPDCVGTGVGQERAVPVGIPFLLCLFSCIFTWWNNNVTLHYWNSPINTPRLTGATHHVIFSIPPRRFNSDPSSLGSTKVYFCRSMRPLKTLRVCAVRF